MPEATRLCDVEGCGRKHRARGLCAMHYKQAGLSAPTRYPVVCRVCGADHLSARKDGQFCSNDCKAEHYRTERAIACPLPPTHPVLIETARRKAEEQAARAALDVAAKSARLRAWRTPRDCAWCGATFSPLRTPRQATCSLRCGKQVNRADRRVRIKGVYVEPVNWRIVYRRDGAACYLCGYETDPDDYTFRVGSDGREAFVAGLEYPSLDHVVPLANGGRHELANARLAHSYCNLLKGDRPLADAA